jgi:hypothetical protein
VCSFSLCFDLCCCINDCVYRRCVGSGRVDGGGGGVVALNVSSVLYLRLGLRRCVPE